MFSACESRIISNTLPSCDDHAFFDIFLQLYNVVVDTQDTGKKLLQKGQLKRRYTIIPLNKIAGRKINPDTIKKAKSLVNEINFS